MEYEPRDAAARARAMQGPIAARLDVIAEDFRDHLGDYSRSIDRLVARLVQARAGSTAPDVGERFPDFMLPDDTGRLWHLAEALEKGPVVLAFHRGYWCDFCHLNMLALAELSPQVAAHGSQIVAISPQGAEHARRLLRESGAGFPMLCDMGLGVSSMLGLTYVMDEDIRRELSDLQVELDVENDGDGRLMPITATFCIDRDGIVVARHLDPDPRRRMDGDAILQAAASCQSAARS